MVSKWRVARRSIPCLGGGALLALLLGAPIASAQTSNGVISGRVVDPQGAVVPGAQVVLTQDSTHVMLATTTDGSGNFVFPSVAPERYSVSVEVQGFKRLERHDLVLTASGRLSVGTLALEVGVNVEVISVTGEAPLVQVSSQERSAVLDDKQMSNISTQGRDYMNMLKLLPGVAYPTENGNQTLGVSSAPIINGVRSDYMAINLDGVVANNRGLGATENQVNLDAVAEVKVLMSNYQAEYGKNSGAIVNVVTKSGTRDFHGAGYYYKRDERLNANDYFNKLQGLPRSKYRYDTVGYNIGGPVPVGGLKDKLFFFWSQEIQPNTRPSTRTYTFPTALERQGNFSQSLDSNGKLIVIKNPITGQAFPGNIIPAGMINPNMQKLLNLFPLPNFFDTKVSGGQYNYVTSDSVDNPVHQELLRLDYAPSESWRFSLRGMFMSVKTKGLAVTANTNNWGIEQTYDTTNPNVSFGATYFASPTLVNEFSAGFSRWTEDQNIDSSELAKIQKDQLGMSFGTFNPGLNPLNLVPAATFGGLPGTANIGYDGRFPMSNYVNAYSVSDSISKVAGPHTLKAGIYAEYAVYLQRHSGGNFAGQLNFGKSSSNPLDTNDPYSNALLGYFQQYSEPTSRLDYQPVNEVLEWFVQDNWKLSPRLTLDYGVRFTYDIPPYAKEDVAGNFYPDQYSRAQEAVIFVPAKDASGKRVAKNPLTGQLFPEAYIGYFVPGSGNPYSGSLNAGSPGLPSGFVNSNGVLFGPRAGFSYDPSGNGKTAIRGGFGIFYNARPRSGQMGDMTFNPPNQAQQAQFNGNVNNILGAGTLLAPSSFNRVVDPNGKNVSFYQMSFGVQQDIGWRTVLDVAYTGNLGRHLGQTVQINNVPYGARFLPQNQDPTTGKPLPDNFFRPYYGYAGIPLLEFTGSSSYHALQTQLRHAFSHGLQFNVSWTWSKSMNYGDNYDNGVATFNNLHFWNYGPSSNDHTHTVVANWVWDVPKASKLIDSGIVKALFDNWRFSGIYAYVTGAPSGVTMTTTDSADLTGGGDGSTITMNGTARLPSGQQTFNRWFDTSVFSRTAVGSVGSGAAATRDAFRLPAVNNWDFTFFKDIPISKAALQLRWEMYNAFNHPQFNAVDTTARFDAQGNQINPRFGSITGARSGRIQQLAVRVTF
jgi:hypothetical protein